MFKIRIRELREAAGYKSQQAFADAFGVAQSTVGGWESGKREPNYQTTIRISDFFGVSVDYLLGHTVQTVSVSNDSMPAAVPFSPHERELIFAYRRADERSQHMVDLALEPFQGAKQDGESLRPPIPKRA